MKIRLLLLLCSILSLSACYAAPGSELSAEAVTSLDDVRYTVHRATLAQMYITSAPKQLEDIHRTRQAHGPNVGFLRAAFSQCHALRIQNPRLNEDFPNWIERGFEPQYSSFSNGGPRYHSNIHQVAKAYHNSSFYRALLNRCFQVLRQGYQKTVRHELSAIPAVQAQVVLHEMSGGGETPAPPANGNILDELDSLEGVIDVFSKTEMAYEIATGQWTKEQVLSHIADNSVGPIIDALNPSETVPPLGGIASQVDAAKLAELNSKVKGSLKAVVADIIDTAIYGPLSVVGIATTLKDIFSGFSAHHDLQKEIRGSMTHEEMVDALKKAKAAGITFATPLEKMGYLRSVQLAETEYQISNELDRRTRETSSSYHGERNKPTNDGLQWAGPADGMSRERGPNYGSGGNGGNADRDRPGRAPNDVGPGRAPDDGSRDRTRRGRIGSRPRTNLTDGRGLAGSCQGCR